MFRLFIILGLIYVYSWALRLPLLQKCTLLIPHEFYCLCSLFYLCNLDPELEFDFNITAIILLRMFYSRYQNYSLN